VLLNSQKQEIGTFDPPNVLSVTLDSTLNAGTYFMVLSAPATLMQAGTEAWVLIILQVLIHQ
jgi:hypothetical protein